MNWAKTHKFISYLFPKYVWKIPNKKNKIYLTFDDGPIPNVTEWVLDFLKNENIKATFFCIGENVQKHPKIFERIKAEGHALGNHTFNHLNGWKTKRNVYLSNFDLCEKEIENSTLFRPPYGKISPLQAKAILKNGKKIIMWDVLSYDFDNKISPQKCLNNVIENTESGSIVVFHDSLKAEHNLRYTLPRAILYLKDKGFKFDVVS